MFKKLPLIVRQLLIIIFIYGLIVEGALLLTTTNILFNSIGLWAGLVLAMGMCIHMHQSLDYAIDLGESQAEKHIKKTYALRTGVVLMCMVILHYRNTGSIITAIIGIMGLKVAAYLQPITHKFTEKMNKKGR